MYKIYPDGSSPFSENNYRNSKKIFFCLSKEASSDHVNERVISLDKPQVHDWAPYQKTWPA